MVDPAAWSCPPHPVELRRPRRSPLASLTAHVRDLLDGMSPPLMRSRSGFAVPLRNRTERRIYERVFVEDMFPLAYHARLVSGRPPTVADIGAYVGMFSLLVADWFPQARVHLFEPVPRLARRAAALARLNGLESLWQVHQAVISDVPGTCDLHCPRSGLGATLIAAKAGELGGARRVLRVPAVRLDDHAAAHGLAGFDIVKLDTEGVEYAAIASGRGVLARAQLVFVRVFPPRTTPRRRRCAARAARPARGRAARARQSRASLGARRILRRSAASRSAAAAGNVGP